MSSLPKSVLRGLRYSVAALFAISASTATAEVLFQSDFSSSAIGEKPIGFDHVRPLGGNIGANDPFPVAWQSENGPVGAVMVGEGSTPAASLPGAGNRSLRIYDYTSSGQDPRAYVAKNFVADAINNRQDVRIDLRFRRSTFIQQDPAFPGDVLVIGLGEFAPGMTFNSAANRAFDFRLANEGFWIAGGATIPEMDPPSGSYLGDAVNELTLVANAHPDEALNYEGPLGAHSLAPRTYAAYLNGVRIVDQRAFLNALPLGKLAFMTGTGAVNADIDFVIDDLVISGYRATETVEFVLDYTEDFEDQTVGAPPAGSFYARPGAAGVGLTVVGAETTPTSIEGKSVRVFDTSASERAVLEDNFVPGTNEYRPDVRFDFTFRRSQASALTGTNNVLYASLGAIGSGMYLHTNARRALEVRIGNDGNIRVSGDGLTDNHRFEPFEQIGDHQVSIFANAQAEGVSYRAPDGQRRSLEGYSFSVFLNGQLLEENHAFRRINGVVEVPDLGRWGFVTGVNQASTGIDFVIDNIRISQFVDEDEAPELPVLRIAASATPGHLVLSWAGASGVAYRLEQSADLVQWGPVAGTFAGTGAMIEHQVAIGGATRGFYRLALAD